MKSNEKRLYRTIANELLALINSGEFPVGSRLPAERDLAERFSVSRPTIREAIIALEAKGFLTAKTGSGVYVLEPAAEMQLLNVAISPFELVEARVFLEGEAAALAAALITNEQLAQLKLALDEMATENLQHRQGSTIADRKFHSIISDAANNRVLSIYISQLWDMQERQNHISRAHRAVCMQDAPRRLAEHKAIYDALSQKDGHAARIAMKNHFSRTLSALHDTNEEYAVSEVRRKATQMRERFSIDRMVGIPEV